MAADYDEGHESTLRGALHRMGFWRDAAKVLPKPEARATGRAERSSVYFVYLPQESDEGFYCVAKFDEPKRAKFEWRAIQELRRLHTPP
jgi:hypothetical protein